LLELLLRVEARQLELLKVIAGKSAVEATTVEAPPVRVEVARANRYDVVTLDLSTARSDEPLGLKAAGIVASSITWLRVDAPVTYKLNSVGNKPLSASVGASHDNWEIWEVYVSNDAAAGKYAVLYYEWRE